MTGISIYLIGILVQIPFLSTAFYTGALVEPLGGVDVSWIVGLLLPGALYTHLRVPRASRAAAACPARLTPPVRFRERATQLTVGIYPVDAARRNSRR